VIQVTPDANKTDRRRLLVLLAIAAVLLLVTFVVPRALAGPGEPEVGSVSAAVTTPTTAPATTTTVVVVAPSRNPFVPVLPTAPAP
jgi:hypothetical protein